ncbi:MAG: AMP-binding protein [Burkholderiaceae bacterium]|nr:AMP-binding protein [Microbacteriaceae bacterium]
MSRTLLAIDAGNPRAVLETLRDALSAVGPAVLPVAEGTRPADLPATVPQRVALVIETSGSTGRPKRVALSSDAVLASAAASDSALGGPGQWLLALPVHYIAGANVLIRSITAQTDPVILAAGPFDPAGFGDAAARLDGDLRYTSLVPVQLARLVDAATADAALAGVLRRFDRILVGGQALDPALLDRARALGLSVARSYGSSETSGGCVYDGVPIGTAHAQVRDGEAWIAGPMLAEGYLLDPDRTADRFVMRDGERWYRTGDAAELSDGRLRITGRLDNVIISGGLKVSLDAVERVVRWHLADAVVVAADSPTWGQVPVVVSTSTTDLTALRAAVVAELGRAAAPDQILTLERMLRLPSGKPDLPSLLAAVAEARGSGAGSGAGA